ncbi:MAG: hypothetical protein A2Y64_05215 [Candidatus Coatesbacteria bacterium RBG_13_66_14]|uniref:Autotransporter domain-containing protein n=1 Tax=Candidatus Coatesbacteria bacterium RBG_13_66_14 TaxID=1817816 RepID=A0A1F5F4U6_9BACT|nr:MAG: hypothetical protein A2Y64_05215 [Candidatus Coatesbacteria bacterium RBG_13_66_14]
MRRAFILAAPAILFLAACAHYLVEGSARQTAAYNALGEPADLSALPESLTGDPADDPSAAGLADGAELSVTAGGRLERFAVTSGGDSAYGGGVGLGSAGLAFSCAADGWGLAGAVVRRSDFTYLLEEGDRRLALSGDLWGLNGAVSYGDGLRFGLGAEGLYGGWRYEEPDGGVEEGELFGWRARLGLRYGESGWSFGLRASGPAELGRGPGLPWEADLWLAVPLTDEGGLKSVLEVAAGGYLFGPDARLIGEQGQDYSARLADGLRGRVGLAWDVSENFSFGVGAFLSAYPVKDNDAERLLWQVYTLGAGFGENPRWGLEASFSQVGVEGEDGYAGGALHLSLGADFAL